MKEKISMSREIIEVLLHDDNGTDTLLFEIPGVKAGIPVNLNAASGQSDLKKVFEKLIKKLNVNDIELKLKIDEQYKKNLYIEVCNEYISDLNKEIKEVRTEIKNL